MDRRTRWKKGVVYVDDKSIEYLTFSLRAALLSYYGYRPARTLANLLGDLSCKWINAILMARCRIVNDTPGSRRSSLPGFSFSLSRSLSLSLFLSLSLSRPPSVCSRSLPNLPSLLQLSSCSHSRNIGFSVASMAVHKLSSNPTRSSSP